MTLFDFYVQYDPSRGLCIAVEPGFEMIRLDTARYLWGNRLDLISEVYSSFSNRRDAEEYIGHISNFANTLIYVIDSANSVMR